MNFAIFRAMCLIKVLSCKMHLFALLLLFFVSSNLFHGIHGLENQQQLPANQLVVINHGFCQSCSREFKSLKDVHTYSDLKYDPRASLPSSFTFCVSVLVTRNNLGPPLFTSLGNDGQPWFSAKIAQFGSFCAEYYMQSHEMIEVSKADTSSKFFAEMLILAERIHCSSL